MAADAGHRQSRHAAPARFWGVNHALQIFGIAGLLAVKAADVTMTLTMLELGLVREANPVAQWAIGAVGPVTGVLALAAVFLVVVIVPTEYGAMWARIYTGRELPGAAVRAVGYGGAIAITVLALAWNAHVVAAVVL